MNINDYINLLSVQKQVGMYIRKNIPNLQKYKMKDNLIYKQYQNFLSRITFMKNQKVMIDFDIYDFRKQQQEQQQITIKHLFKDLFPYYQIQSVITIILILQTLLFIISFLINILSSNNHNQISPVIIALRCYPHLIKQYQIHRIFTSLVVYNSLDNLLLNTIFLFMILSFLQKKMGTWKFIFYYVCTGVIGNMISILTNNNACASNFGSFSLFLYSLKLQYQIFKSNNYIQYQNYNQPLGLYMYKAVLFSYMIYEYSLNQNGVNFSMYLGGLLGIIMLQSIDNLVYWIKITIMILTTCMMTGIFLGFRHPGL